MRALDVSLPAEITAVVAEAAGAGGQVAPTAKAVTLDNGATLAVPPHVREGDTVVVRLGEDGAEYGGRR